MQLLAHAVRAVPRNRSDAEGEAYRAVVRQAGVLRRELPVEPREITGRRLAEQRY